MDRWTETADRLWQAILARAKDLRDEGETLQSIANKVGVEKVLIHYWLSGTRKAVDASFANLMTYAERLGIDYRNYFPGGDPPVQEAPSCATCKKLLAKEKELQKAQKELDRMRLELAKRDGMVEALERQLDRRDATGRQEPPKRKAAG